MPFKRVMRVLPALSPSPGGRIRRGHADPGSRRDSGLLSAIT
jgi:hypothetical protein